MNSFHLFLCTSLIFLIKGSFTKYVHCGGGRDGRPQKSNENELGERGSSLSLCWLCENNCLIFHTANRVLSESCLAEKRRYIEIMDKYPAKMINSLRKWTLKHCYGCTYLSDRAKLRELKNGKFLICLYYLMNKFESYLEINNNNNKNNRLL